MLIPFVNGAKGQVSATWGQVQQISLLNFQLTLTLQSASYTAVQVPGKNVTATGEKTQTTSLNVC